MRVICHIKLRGWQRWLLAFGMMMSVSVQADPANDEIAELKRQIQLLSQKVDALEAHQQTVITPASTKPVTNSVDATTTPPVPTEPASRKGPIITAGEEGFSLQSADTNFTLHIGGYGQVDARYYASPAAAKDTMTIRRLRAIASGTVYKDYDYYMQVDFASGTTSTTTNNSFLQDAYVNIHYIPEWQIQVGKFKVPVSLEILPLDQYLWFLERSLPTELAPNRDVGAEMHGLLFDGALNYGAGVFNGVPDGGSGDAEVADNTKDVVARLFALPFKNTSYAPLKQLGLGLGSSYGLQAGTTTPTFATVARQTFFKYNTTVSETGQHLRLDPQAYYFWGPLGVFGEYIVSDEKFKIAGAHPSTKNLNSTGWDVTGSYFITGEDNNWAVLPMVKHPFRFDGSGWGAFQFAARYNHLALDPAAFPLYAAAGSAQAADSWSVALNWYLNRNVKWIFEYSQTAFDGGSKAPGALTAQDERAFLARLQFGF